MTEHILVEDEGALRIIRINRPEKKNALTLAMYGQMTEALLDADRNTAIRCIVIAGASGAFTAGNDIGDFAKAATGGMAWNRAALSFLDALARCPKPIVAAVGGVAVGIGTTMLFHCDHVVVANEATLSTPFLRLGLLPEAASTLLAPARMGYARAFSLLVMGRPLSAAEAKDGGLVNTIVAASEVDRVAMSAAREIAALPPRALAVTRELMRGNIDEVTERIEAEGSHFSELLQSEEARTAFAAFFARKK